ncbi:LutC/YkgG family protein [Bacillus sp. FJAT-45350]|uniref:LutC/YkgG family protein n=1 Tax=Bacillus sp. FJAT-45350 TaxID=2011014 RepID=UPI000BB770EE|nr:lactate utilization protein [Bacillus sp. FJAT-45350]
MKKERFFQQIRNQLGRTEESTVATYEQGAPSYYKDSIQTTEEKVALFIKNVKEVGGNAYSVANKEEARHYIKDILEVHKATSIIQWDDPLLNEIKVEEVTQGKAEIHIWNQQKTKEENINIAKYCEVGITTADFAIANTGTVALLSDGRKGRSVSLLPPIYIVVVKAEQLITRMGEGFPLIRERATSSLNFITGPSKSADIESNLTIGVHGPKHYYALILK